MRKQRLTEDELSSLIKEQIEDKSRYIYQIEVKDKIIANSFTFFTGLPVRIIFKECIFLDEFSFGAGKFEFDVTFSHCYFLKLVGIISNIFSRSLTFINCKLKNDFIILDSTINEIIGDFTFCKRVLCSFDNKFKRLSLTGRSNIIFEDLMLSLNSIEEKFYVANCNFKKVCIANNLKGLQRDKELEISNCRINSFFIDSLSNSGLFKLFNIQSLSLPNQNSFFSISKSNLGEAEFIQFDFSSFSEINIINSYLGDCIFVNTTWSPSNINTFKGKEMDGYLTDRIKRRTTSYKLNKFLFENRLSQLIYHPAKVSVFKETRLQLTHKKDVFKQIKYALSKQGDYINEKLFYCLEMTTYNKSLPLNIKNFSTKLILFLSKITSNYGLSLKRPLILILTNCIPFYLLVLKEKIPGVYSTSFFSSTHLGICNAIAQFLYMLNPLRKFELDLNGSALIFDIWIRIISSYAIYNIIRVTRRFIN
jgi:hypothetical protein